MVALCLGALGIACTANPGPRPEAAAEKPAATQAISDVPVVATTPTAPVTAPVVAQAEPTAPVVAPTPVLAEPVAAQPGADAVPGVAPIATLPPPVAVAEVERLAPAWELVTKTDKEVELETLAVGVLARLGGVFHEVGPDGALVEKPAADPVLHQRTMQHYDIEGVWPDDVWWVKETMHERDGSDLSFYKWRANNRWVAQSDAGTTKWDRYDLLVERWTPRSGYLLVATDDDNRGVANFTRLAGKHPAPEPIAYGTNNLHDVYESAGGTVFLFTEATDEGRSGSYDILRSCKPGEAPGCERSGGFTLPPVGGNGGYVVGLMAARNRWSMSAVINAAHEPGNKDREKRYLVHYETGGWKLDAVPGDLDVRQMLAAPDGGLWLVLGEKPQSLWHRSDAGKWVAVDLPADLVGAEKIQVALRDPTHVWVAGNVGENHAIHAAPAALQGPGVAVPVPSPAG